MKIPGYELQGTLGAGGMATVFRAVQLSLNRAVALKVMREDMSRTPDFTRRFLIEARSVAQLQHRHIISIYDVGTTKDIHFYSMQLLEGGNLLERIHAGSMERKEIVQALAAVCDALQYSHERGFIHRDVKPANILFDAHNEPYLTDFGLVRDLNTTSALTAAGHSLGTSLYMSPEQITGQSVSPKCDLYGLGVTAYEAIIGTTPYRGETSIAVAYQHVNEPVPQLGKAMHVWQTFFDRAMAKSPDDRFDDAADMAAALRELLSNDEAMTAKEKLTDSGEQSGNATMIMPNISEEAEFQEIGQQENTAEPEDEEDFGTVVMRVPGAAAMESSPREDPDEDTTQRIQVDSGPAPAPEAEPQKPVDSSIGLMPDQSATPREKPAPGTDEPGFADKLTSALAGFGDAASTAVKKISTKTRDLATNQPKQVAAGLGTVGAIALALIIWGLWPDAAPEPIQPTFASADAVADLRTRMLSEKASFERQFNDLYNNTRWSYVQENHSDLTAGLEQARSALGSIEDQLNASENLTEAQFAAIADDLGNADTQATALVDEVRKLLRVQDKPEPMPVVINTEIEVLLEQANTDLEAGRLFQPENNNALDKVAAALELDPEYRNTLTIRSTLVDSILELARNAIDNGQLTAPAGQSALDIIAVTDSIDPDNQRAGVLRDQIVSSLVSGARTDIEAGRLLAPVDQNAAQKLNQALGVAPESADVLTARSELLEVLLVRAEEDISSNRLTSPRGENADEKLNLAATLDPGNELVRALRARMGRQYLALISSELNRASPSRSNMSDWLEQARKFGAPEQEITATQGKMAKKDQVTFVADLNAKAERLMTDERYLEAQLTSYDILRMEAQNKAATTRLGRIEELTKEGFVYFHQVDPETPGPTMVVLGGSDSVTVPGSDKQIFITKAFAISTNEISRSLFARFSRDTNYKPPGRGGRNCRRGTPGKSGSAFSKKVNWNEPGFDQGADHPAVCVDFAAAISFAEWLSQKTGRKYRLPSEIEWEYASRSRKATPVNSANVCDMDNVADQAFVRSEKHRSPFACNDGSAFTSPHQAHGNVAGKIAGIAGNVSEWTTDCWNKSLAKRPNSSAPWTEGDCRKRVVRGGSFRSGSKTNPIDYRAGAPTDMALDSVGFRVVREYD